MSSQPVTTWKGRIIAFSISAVVCIAAVEGVARFLERGDRILLAMQLDLQPYMMFAGHTIRGATWRNTVNNTDVPSTIVMNNFGFNVDDDFTIPLKPEIVKKYAKKPDERLIVITGGSVIHGVGATANDKTIAGQLQVILNKSQSRFRYRVVNLGMGSWVAYQQFIGLSLFALPLHPDWVVVMDAHNDAAVACAHGSGAGNPMNWPQMLYLTGGGTGVSRMSAPIQWLIRNTAIARLIFNISKFEADNPYGGLDRLYVDDEDLDKRFMLKMKGLTLSELDKQLAFYLLAQENVKDLFSSANLLFSTQPLLNDNAVVPLTGDKGMEKGYRATYDLRLTPGEADARKKQLDGALADYMSRSSGVKCNSAAGALALGYFTALSALRLEQTVGDWASHASGRSILYANAEGIFPTDPPLRNLHFIDNAHMTDMGQSRVAEYYARHILAADLKTPFDEAQFADDVQAAAARQLKATGTVKTESK